LLTGIFPLFFYVSVILDIFTIFPRAAHLKYDITYWQLKVKRIIYPNISFPCSSIFAIEKAELLNLVSVFRAVSSLGCYKITYTVKKKEHEFMKSVIIGAKPRDKFLSELALNVNAKLKNDIKDLIKDFNINGNTVVRF